MSMIAHDPSIHTIEIETTSPESPPAAFLLDVDSDAKEARGENVTFVRRGAANETSDEVLGMSAPQSAA